MSYGFSWRPRRPDIAKETIGIEGIPVLDTLDLLLMERFEDLLFRLWCGRAQGLSIVLPVACFVQHAGIDLQAAALREGAANSSSRGMP